MSSQKISFPQLQAGEQIILQGQGAYKENLRSGWKIARCFLTNQRFIIYQTPTIRFQISLSDIVNLSVEKLNYVIRKREAISLSYKTGKDSKEYRLYLVTSDLENWKKRIYQGSLLKVDLDTIERIAAGLDPQSRDILWYLWDNNNARIDQLAELIGAPNHMHVLFKIRETINPVAEKVIGCPILSFERSRVDPKTGEKVLFSWWLMGQQEKWIQKEDRLLDIFDEGSYIQVIMEVRGVEASDLKLDVHEDQLTVRSHKIGATLRETFRLPAQVRAHNHQMHLKNNLLEIRLSKVQGPVSSEE